MNHTTTTSRKKLLAGNWKMNMRLGEIAPFFDSFSAALNPGTKEQCDILFAAPFTQLQATIAAARGRGFAASAQNMHFESSGAFTGEVSPAMLADIGIRTTLVGHSERRQYFAETDDSVAKKTVTAVRMGITPIVCIGETLEERKLGKTFEVVARQTKVFLEALKNADHPSAVAKSREAFYPGDLTDGLVIAYEPVWAIGTGLSATFEQAQEVHAQIRKVCAETISSEFACKVRILYGGSANPSNIAGLLGQPDIDGGLVGGASLKPVDFAAMCNAAANG
jgi:triosephosphate isomerase